MGSRAAASDWLDRYAHAWEAADPVAAAALFGDDATYRFHVFRPPHEGRAAIARYWETATSSQSDVRVRIGSPVVDGARVAAEWWTTMTAADEGDVTLPGILVLDMADGACRALLEYRHLQRGHVEPYEGWGVVDDTPGIDARALAWAWARAYGAAWQRGDADAIPALFTDDAIYRSHPLRAPHRGRDGIRAYTRAAFTDESERRVRFGTPLASDAAAVLEYWTTMMQAGRPTTLAGCDLLVFAPSGLCRELRECWHMGEGVHDPPPGWGR